LCLNSSVSLCNNITVCISYFYQFPFLFNRPPFLVLCRFGRVCFQVRIFGTCCSGFFLLPGCQTKYVRLLKETVCPNTKNWFNFMCILSLITTLLQIVAGVITMVSLLKIHTRASCCYMTNSCK